MKTVAPPSAAERAMLARNPLIPLVSLSRAWGVELGIEPQTLALNLFNAALDGEFDDVLLPDGKRSLVLHDLNTMIYSDLVGSELNKRIVETISYASKHGLNIDPITIMSKMEVTIGLRREAVWHYCKKFSIKAPSWWPLPKASKQGNGRKTVVPSAKSEAEIMKYLTDLEPKSVTTIAAQQSVMKLYHVPRRIARDLTEKAKELRPGLFLERGQRISRKSAM